MLKVILLVHGGDYINFIQSYGILSKYPRIGIDVHCCAFYRY